MNVTHVQCLLKQNKNKRCTLKRYHPELPNLVSKLRVRYITTMVSPCYYLLKTQTFQHIPTYRSYTPLEHPLSLLAPYNPVCIPPSLPFPIPSRPDPHGARLKTETSPRAIPPLTQHPIHRITLAFTITRERPQICLRARVPPGPTQPRS